MERCDIVQDPEGPSLGCCHRLPGLFGKVVENDRPVGRILGHPPPLDAGGEKAIPYRAAGCPGSATPFHPIGVSGLEKVPGGPSDLVGDLMERCDIVQDPEGPSLGCHHQILLVYRQIGDRRHREVELE
jgi:hypothetical protein